MKKYLTTVCFIATAILGLGLGPVQAAQDKSRMVTTGRTSQPIGHYLFCKQYPAECNVRASSTAPTKLTRQRWDELVAVNDYANDSVIPVTDMEYYNVEEYWAYPDKYGDCEDYALMKRQMLMQRGWPASSLLITVVRQTNGEGHAVLTVRTDRADYVLDNLDGRIFSWDKTEYTYLKRQSVKNSGQWSTISDNHNPVVGSIN